MESNARAELGPSRYVSTLAAVLLLAVPIAVVLLALPGPIWQAPKAVVEALAIAAIVSALVYPGLTAWLMARAQSEGLVFVLALLMPGMLGAALLAVGGDAQGLLSLVWIPLWLTFSLFVGITAAGSWMRRRTAILSLGGFMVAAVATCIVAMPIALSILIITTSSTGSGL